MARNSSTGHMKKESRGHGDRAHSASIPTTIKNPERVAFRRNELVEVATRMFLENGFHNTSIRDIVRACSFNVASLYMYVSSKEDILYLVAQDLMSTIAAELTETRLDPASPERSLEIGFDAYCRIAYRFRRHIRLLYREVGFLPTEPRSHVLGTVSNVVTFFEHIFEQGIEAGTFRMVLPRLAALNAVVLAHTIALHTQEVMTITDLEAYIQLQLENIFAGILADSSPNRPVSAARRRGARPAGRSGNKHG